MNIIRTLSFVIAIAFGVFLFVYGEMDDSPGGQFLGLVMAVAGIVALIRRTKRGAN